MYVCVCVCTRVCGYRRMKQKEKKKRLTRVSRVYRFPGKSREIPYCFLFSYGNPVTNFCLQFHEFSEKKKKRISACNSILEKRKALEVRRKTFLARTFVKFLRLICYVEETIGSCNKKKNDRVSDFDRYANRVINLLARLHACFSFWKYFHVEMFSRNVLFNNWHWHCYLIIDTCS